jgi:hypothetical protein
MRLYATLIKVMSLESATFSQQGSVGPAIESRVQECLRANPYRRLELLVPKSCVKRFL